MKRIIVIAFCLIIGGVTTVYGQTTKEERVQKILEKNQQREIYRAELEEAMLGFHMGGEYSFRSFGTIGVMGAQKHGIHALAGYRFTKHWYVGGIVGVDLTTPFTIKREGYSNEKLNYSFERQDKIYVPVMADVRFYFKPNKVTTYLFTNIGAEFSSIIAPIGILGLGFDVNTVKDQCVNIGLGLGLGSWGSAEGTHMASLDRGNVKLEKTDGFVFNFKLGYSF